MNAKQVLLVRGASLAAVAAAAGLLAYTHQVAQFAVAEASELTELQAPLYVAVAIGAGLTVAAASIAWIWSSEVTQASRAAPRAVSLLGWLRAVVALLGLYIAVCTIGMSVVLDGFDFDAPGVVLAAICAEVVLGALSLALAHQHRQARIELTYARRNPTAVLAH